jgi:hypothetical protein
MNDHDREQLKARLRWLASGPLGLQLDTREHWAINGIHEPRRFFQHLSLLLEPHSILYLEGIRIHREAAVFYTKHKTMHPVDVACGTVFPIPHIYHLDFSPEVVAGIVELAARRPIGELLNHIAAYRLGRLTFLFHDAFEGYLKISDCVPEPVVVTFSRALGVSYSREITNLHPNPYRDLLYAFEHAEELRMCRMPWWRKVVNEFLSGFREG